MFKDVLFPGTSSALFLFTQTEKSFEGETLLIIGNI